MRESGIAGRIRGDSSLSQSFIEELHGVAPGQLYRGLVITRPCVVVEAVIRSPVDVRHVVDVIRF